jgi:polysaccharide biosynthesis transport protein
MNENLNCNQNTEPEPDKRLIGSKDRIIELLPIGSNCSLRSGFLNSATDATEAASLEELFNKIWSGKWTILTIVLVITTATLFFLRLTTPVFSAQALILLESREQNLIGITPVITSLDEQTQKVESEIELLKAPALALKVIEHLHLHRLKEFNPTLRPMGIFDQAQGSLNRWLAPLITAPKKEVLTEEQRHEKERAVIINEFLGHLKVVPQGRSRVISVSFTSEDPHLAARIVNTLIDTYISQQLAAKLEPIERANTWLTMRLSVLREKVEAAETAVERLRQEFGLVHGQSGITLESQQISELNTQLIMVRAQGAEAEARLRPVKSLVNSQGKRVPIKINELKFIFCCK